MNDCAKILPPLTYLYYSIVHDGTQTDKYSRTITTWMPYVMIFSMSKSFSTTYFGSVLDNRQAGAAEDILLTARRTLSTSTSTSKPNNNNEKFLFYWNLKSGEKCNLRDILMLTSKLLKSTFYEIFWNCESKENKNKAHVLILNNKYYIINVTIFKNTREKNNTFFEKKIFLHVWNKYVPPPTKYLFFYFLPKR